MIRTVQYLFIALVLLPFNAYAKIGGGDVVFTVNKAGNVLFSHDAHVGKHGLKCTSCHYHLYTTSKRRSAVTMADMEKGESCGACHTGEKVFGVKGNCKRCHTR